MNEEKSPPSWWSGLKYSALVYVYTSAIVSTLVVEWIEIFCPSPWARGSKVSTLVVEWIEINQ